MKPTSIILQTNPNTIAEICSTEKFHMPLQENMKGQKQIKKKETNTKQWKKILGKTKVPFRAWLAEYYNNHHE